MKRSSGRPQKLGDLIQRELSQLVQQELRDPRVGMITLTGVDVSPDLSHAKVFFTTLSKENLDEAKQGLRRAAGFLRSQLARRIRLYTTPELRFEYDESVERGDRLSRLIDSTRGEQEVSHGALLLDKPVGISSNRALQQAKRIYGAAKAGHAGTLDPLASGLLLVLFGEATKLAGPLLEDDKEYVATLKLGEKTSTGDAEGEILETRSVALSRADLEPVLARFRGEIEQVPPMYSALKRGGVPLYKLARRGQTVERAARRVRISALECLDFTPPRLRLRVGCSKGTYVRTLAEDIGEALGTCAHLTALRRTAAGQFRVEDAATLDSLAAMPAPQRAQRLLGLAQLLHGLPRAQLDAPSEARFRNGQPLQLSLTRGLCAVYGADGGVIGLGQAEAGGALRPLRLLAASQAADKHPKTL